MIVKKLVRTLIKEQANEDFLDDASLVFHWNTKDKTLFSKVPGQGTGTFTNTDGTNRWYLDPSDNLYKAAAANQPRFVAEGMLLEQASTNLIYPAIPDAVSWTLLDLTIATGKANPAGGTDAVALCESENNCYHGTNTISVAAVQNDFVSFTAFVKAGTRSECFIAVNIYDATPTFGEQVYAYYNLTTGAVGAAASTGAGATLVGTIPAQEHANGWWRIGVVLKVDWASAATVQAFVGPSVAGNHTYDGDAGSPESMHAWRCQVEKYATVPRFTASIPSTSGTAGRTGETLATGAFSFTKSAAFLALDTSDITVIVLTYTQFLPVVLSSNAFNFVFGNSLIGHVIANNSSIGSRFLPTGDAASSIGIPTSTGGGVGQPPFGTRILIGGVCYQSTSTKRGFAALADTALNYAGSTPAWSKGVAATLLVPVMASGSLPAILEAVYIYNRILSSAEILAHWRY